MLARIGKASLGAHQIAFQLYNLLALVLDALAIAGQVLVGRMLGAGDGEGAYEAARRLTVLSIAGGVARRRGAGGALRAASARVHEPTPT